jgi:hypothetical protein
MESMETDHPQSAFHVSEAFSPDLAPLYQHTERDYQATVNGLSNLMVSVIAYLQETEQATLAQQIADQAHGVLVRYDEDMAEQVRWVTRGAEDVIESLHNGRASITEACHGVISKNTPNRMAAPRHPLNIPNLTTYPIQDEIWRLRRLITMRFLSRRLVRVLSMCFSG